MMTAPNNKITISKCLRALFVLVFATLGSCGGSGNGGGSDNNIGTNDATEAAEPTPPPIVSNFAPAPQCLLPQGSVTPIPDINDPDIPVITLEGDHLVFLSVGETYEEPGATAIDPIDGNITDSISILGEDTVDTSELGDYLIRYNVQNSAGVTAREVVRIIRVSDAGNVATLSSREFGTTSSIHGYFEHLPESYSNDVPSPLIIYNHGDGGAGSNLFPDGLLNRSQNNDPTGLIASGDWDFSRPFIVLSPQRCLTNNVFLETLRINRFIDYATQTYNVDTSRIYMVGFSAGAFITWFHESLFPGQIAAIGAIAGGTLDLEACDLRNTPSWTFHAEDDTTVPVGVSTGLFELLNACDPPAPVPPLLTIFPSGGHVIVNQVMNLSLLGGGLPEFDTYDESIYDWLLSHSLP